MSFPLSDYIVEIVDCLHATAPYTEKGHPLIRTTDIQNGRLLLEQTMRVSDETYETWTQRSVPQEGDLVMAREAPVGAVGIVPKNVNVCLGQRTVQIIPERDKIYPKYLLYALTHAKTQRLIERYTVGSTVKRINVRDILKLKIPFHLPDLETQKEIGDKIYLYDEKIQLNKNLMMQFEEYTQLLFRKWFVDFNFPNKQGESYKEHGGEMIEVGGKLIPKGWRSVKFKELFSFEKGVMPNEVFIENYGAKKAYLTIEFLEEGKGQFTNEQPNLLESRDLDILMVMDGSRSGKVFTAIDGYVGSTLAKIVPKEEIYRDVGYMFLKSRERAISNRTTGSAVPHTSKSYVNSLVLNLPEDKSKLSAFAEKFSVIREKISLLQKENVLLSETRDLLIHKLIK
ncbi:restriction endonuclease subunit S [Priestia filamentosa]|uniref:restriction endonuclease subunit S n=1 Tax=Priestia filamentosa TaxID=1402861 RepID=UPI00397917EF